MINIFKIVNDYIIYINHVWVYKRFTFYSLYNCIIVKKNDLKYTFSDSLYN